MKGGAGRLARPFSSERQKGWEMRGHHQHRTSSFFRAGLAGAAICAMLVWAGAAAPAASAAPALYNGASGDGSKVFFSTSEALVPADTDSRTDIYQRSFDVTLGDYVSRELSTGPAGGNDAFAATYRGASGNGDRVYF